jgi:hypothetical protein
MRLQSGARIPFDTAAAGATFPDPCTEIGRQALFGALLHDGWLTMYGAAGPVHDSPVGRSQGAGSNDAATHDYRRLDSHRSFIV